MESLKDILEGILDKGNKNNVGKNLPNLNLTEFKTQKKYKEILSPFFIQQFFCEIDDYFGDTLDDRIWRWLSDYMSFSSPYKFHRDPVVHQFFKYLYEMARERCAGKFIIRLNSTYLTKYEVNELKKLFKHKKKGVGLSPEQLEKVLRFVPDKSENNQIEYVSYYDKEVSDYYLVIVPVNINSADQTFIRSYIDALAKNG